MIYPYDVIEVILLCLMTENMLNYKFKKISKYFLCVIIYFCDGNYLLHARYVSSEIVYVSSDITGYFYFFSFAWSYFLNLLQQPHIIFLTYYFNTRF